MTLWVGFAICLAGCSTFGDREPAPTLDDAAREERIETLTTAIRQDHVRLESLITQPRTETALELHRDPEIERIGHRLNQNERELDALRRSARNDSR
jgi:hypothetical protein